MTCSGLDLALSRGQGWVFWGRRESATRRVLAPAGPSLSTPPPAPCVMPAWSHRAWTGASSRGEEERQGCGYGGGSIFVRWDPLWGGDPERESGLRPLHKLYSYYQPADLASSSPVPRMTPFPAFKHLTSPSPIPQHQPTSPSP